MLFGVLCPFSRSYTQPDEIVNSESADILLENNRILKQFLQDVAAIKEHFDID